MHLLNTATVCTFILVAFLCTAHAGEPRPAVIIHAEKPVAHVFAKRSPSAMRRASLKTGDKVALMTDCRNARGTVVITRWDKVIGKAGGNPKAIHGLWCEVGLRQQGSGTFITGWMLGKYLNVLPAN